MRNEKLRDMGTREGMVGTIEDCGRYIADHAEGILGEYPGAALSELTITVSIRFDSIPSVTVNRLHLVIPKEEEAS